MSAISVTYLVLSIVWFFIGIMFLYSTKKMKIENEIDKKYVFNQYLIIWLTLVIQLLCNIFR